MSFHTKAIIIYVTISASETDLVNKIFYTKYEGPALYQQILEVTIVQSRLMCGQKCAGKTDCSAFRVVENAGTLQCDLMKKGVGIPMTDFYTLNNCRF